MTKMLHKQVNLCIENNKKQRTFIGLVLILPQHIYSMHHYLFSYGTLQLEQVQLENYGRKLKGSNDFLNGYRIEDLVITDIEVIRKSGKHIHPVAVCSGNKNDVIKGMIFEITEEELQATDKYEVSDYVRVMEKFESGKEAWIYIGKIKS